MALQDDELSKNLLQSQAHIWNHIFSHMKSMSLKCAVRLQIPDIIYRHGSPMLLSDLVQALGLQQERTQSVYRRMHILVHCDFFVKQSVSTTGRHDEEEEGEGYLLAPPSQLLLKEHPFSLRPYLLAFLDPILTDPWHDMGQMVPKQRCHAFSHNSWEETYSLWSQTLIANITFGGVYSSCIAKKLLNLSSLSFTNHTLNSCHNWNDAECIKILKNCKEAIPSKENGGKLVIIDIVMKVDEGGDELFETQLYFDMLNYDVVFYRKTEE
ncbi:putative O-methyltransferase domain, plant methyltransferase dimerization [Helianthus anomalus]